jgi:hypothetical protein
VDQLRGEQALACTRYRLGFLRLDFLQVQYVSLTLDLMRA